MRPIIVILLSAACAALSAARQAPSTVTVTGRVVARAFHRVKDANGKPTNIEVDHANGTPLAGVQITFFTSKGWRIVQSQTASDGTFKVSAQDDEGQIALRFQKQGYLEKTIIRELKPGQDVAVEDVALRHEVQQ